MTTHSPPIDSIHLTRKILIAMVSAIIIGIGLRFFPHGGFVERYITSGLFTVVGQIFINLMKMLVVPIVLFSLICGTLSLGNSHKLGRLGLKTLLLYLFTTAIALVIALFVGHLLHIGSGAHLPLHQAVKIEEAPPLKTLLIKMIPDNPIRALAEGNMLQIIIFALLFGSALSFVKTQNQKLVKVLEEINHTFMTLILLIMQIAPYAIFCLLVNVVAELGINLIIELFLYFLTVILVLIIQVVVIYNGLLLLFARTNPIRFLMNITSVLLFGFSTSSSNATIPVTLKTVEEKLGVSNHIAAFTIPLGATINMDGTSIMQGVAVIFIANIYHLSLSLSSLLSVILVATLASIGTAGVPSAGMITLAMVLTQAGLPTEGIALIIGVDRLLDMLRTTVNLTGDCVVTYLVAKSEKALSQIDQSASK